MKNRGKTTMLRINETTQRYVRLIASEQNMKSERWVHLGEALQAFIEEHRPDLKEQIDDDDSEEA